MHRNTVRAAALLAIGIVATVLLIIRHRPKVGCSMTADSFSNAFSLSLGATAKTMDDLENASDVVVRRKPSGALTVYGRLVAQKRSVSSIKELKALLRTLPAPGAGLVIVESASKVIEGTLIHPGDPDLRTAETTLIATLAEAGFTQPRGSLKTFLPLGCGPDGRPTTR